MEVNYSSVECNVNKQKGISHTYNNSNYGLDGFELFQNEVVADDMFSLLLDNYDT